MDVKRHLLSCARPFLAAVLIGSAGTSVVAQETAAAPPAGSAAVDHSTTAKDILNLDIEQLAKTPVVVPSMDIPVTSVTKEPSTVGRSAAAVFVITQDMIRRSGANNIPEALRMAPGMDVAQATSSEWAITCRGSNWTFANKMLVLVDGRTVYNHDYSGVYWDVQDMVLEDVERIEVVRGPGGTLWGANAMNGVINIITKSSKDTQGTYVMAGGGSHDWGMEAIRFGGKISDDATYRIYEKYFAVGPNVTPPGQVYPLPIDDAWQQGRAGFRADWQPGADKSDLITVQGDHYVGRTNSSVVCFSGVLLGSFNDRALPEHLTGDNVLLRWCRTIDEDTNWTFQTYYDNFMRSDAVQTEIDRTFDIDVQYQFPLGDRHKITCGGGYRNIESYLPGGDQLGNWFSSPYETTNYINQFVQDEIPIVEDRLTFIIGSKLEEDPYTGLEYQPTARVLLTPDRRHSAWCAVSRAVRTPSRIERYTTGVSGLPVPDDPYPLVPRLYGNGAIVSEAMMAYEVGYREQMTDQLSWDVAAFYNVYDQLIVPPFTGNIFIEDTLAPHIVVPMMYENAAKGDTYGVELFANYAVSDRWRISGQYTLFEMNVNDPSGSNGFVGNDPNNQIYLRSSWDVGENMEFDMMGRYVDRLVSLNVPSYITMDLRFAYRPRKHVELAVVGQNLLQEFHQEFSNVLANNDTDIPRGVYGTVTWRR